MRINRFVTRRSQNKTAAGKDVNYPKLDSGVVCFETVQAGRFLISTRLHGVRNHQNTI